MTNEAIRQDVAAQRAKEFNESLTEHRMSTGALPPESDYRHELQMKLREQADHIAELECALAEEERKAHEELRAHEQITVRAERAEAALREVAELPDKWDSQISPEMLEWLNVCESPPSQANELRGILSKYKEKP